MTSHRFTALLHATLLVGAMAALLCLLGFVLAGTTGVLVAAAAAVFLATFGPRISSRWILRTQGARPIPWHASPELLSMVADLSRRAGLSRAPRLYLDPMPVPQAYAVGDPADPAIAVSRGLLRLLGPRELRAVLAHEITHLRNRDVSVMRLARTFNAVTRSMSTFGVLFLFLYLPLVLVGAMPVSFFAVLALILAPMLAGRLELALSRSRELAADDGAMELTADPRALASALVRMERASIHPLERLLGFRFPQPPEWLRTHPATETRVRRLLRPSASHGRQAAMRHVA